MRLSSSFAALAALISAASALPFARNSTLTARQGGPKQVYAHFMLGIVATYESADWEQDIRQAMGVGIDGFALNAGVDDYTHSQLQLAYAAAEAVGDGKFKLFISFDFTSFPVGDVGLVASYIKEFGNHPAALKYNDKAFVSSFYGDGFQFRAAEAAAGIPIFACPAWSPDALKSADADCGFQWNSWPSENNLPVDKPYSVLVDGDDWWKQNLAGKPYMAGVSPSFFTHFGADTWNKNWIFKSDGLWTERWQQMLDTSPDFVEIITWNDYGESHYIGPLRDEKPEVYAGGPTGAVKWTPGHDHSAFATVAAPYIAAYKQGAASPVITSEHLVYYYRQQSKDLQCSDPNPAPTGAQIMEDAIFVTAITTEPATVVITSGGNAPVSIEVPAGVTNVRAPMGVGKQSFALVRGGSNIMSGDGYRDVRDNCDVYDFNYFAGELQGGSAPSPAPEPAQPAPEPVPAPAPAPAPEPVPAPQEPVPAPQEPVPAPEIPAPVPAASETSFSTTHETVWGENIYVSGSIDTLGSWDASRAVILHTDATTYPNWDAKLAVPAGEAYDYKYILKSADGAVIWEGDVQHSS